MKKKNLLYIACILTTASLSSCDDFLDKEPQDKLTNNTYWQTENSLRTYAQDFYSTYFKGYGTDYTVFGGYFSGDDYTDDFINLNNANTNSAGYIYFPTSATTDWNSKTAPWSDNYGIVYKANVCRVDSFVIIGNTAITLCQCTIGHCAEVTCHPCPVLFSFI